VAWRRTVTGRVSGYPQSEIGYRVQKRRPAENLTEAGQKKSQKRYRTPGLLT
jgi:hypothetical protein